jgi:hypothetical protein
MKRLQIGNTSDLPANFWKNFSLETGAAFDSFLSRCKAHDLFFSVEVPGDNDDGNCDAMSDAINEQVRLIAVGGPQLARPEGGIDQHDVRCWEFLSCKHVKISPKNLRGQQNTDTEKRNFVRIDIPSTQPAPIDFNVNTVTRTFGLKNTIRVTLEEPEKFVIIGM